MANSRDTLKSVRNDIESIVTRLEAADKMTQNNVAALETALRSLAEKGRGDGGRQHEVETQIGALKSHLMGLIRETQKAVNADLKTVLDDPRMSTLATAIDQADSRLRQTEAEQAQNLDILKDYIAELAREVDNNLNHEREARQAAVAAIDAKQTTLQTDIATCLETIKTNTDALDATKTDIKNMAEETALAIQNMGEKVVRVAEQAKDARDEQARVFKAKVSDIALETQHNFNDYREGVDRNIEALQSAHELAKQDFARDLDDLRTRLETLEYGFSPNSATAPLSVPAPTLVDDAFTPMEDITARPTALEAGPVDTIAPQEQLAEAPAPYEAESVSSNPYADGNLAYDNQIDTSLNPHHQDHSFERFDASPYAQLQDASSSIAPSPYSPVDTQGPIHDLNDVIHNGIESPEFDIPYANPAYAEDTATMEHIRPSAPHDTSQGRVKRGSLFTPSNLRAAVLGFAVLGVGYYAVGKFRGGTPTSNDLPTNVFVESQPTDVTISSSDTPADISSSVQTIEPIGNYTNDVAPPVNKNSDAKSLLESAANDGDPIAEYQLGLAKLQSGDTQEALNLLRSSANKGQAAAQYRLAKLYEAGTGVTRDLQTARTLIEKSARNGNRIAMHDLANFYANGIGGVEQDLSFAAQWFEQAAERGVVDSQYNIGYLYEFGFGVTQNAVEAYVWYNIASAQGDTEAGRRLATLNETLSDVEISSAKTRVEGFEPIKLDKDANGIFESPPGRPAKTANSQTQVADVQNFLNNLGYSVGEADGKVGARTRNAIIAFEKANGLPATGRINASLVDQLELATGA